MSLFNCNITMGLNSEKKMTLEEKVEALLQQNTFKVGQSVKWKRGLRNKKFPKDDAQAIVLEVLKVHLIQHETETGSPYFHEPLDIVLAVLDDDEDLVIFHYDSRRFEPY